MKNNIIGLMLAFLCIPDVFSQQINTEKIDQKCRTGVVFIKTSSGRGSGFLVNQEGYIVTNHHTIAGEDAQDISIEFEDGNKYRCKEIVNYLHKDEKNLAILKINPVYDYAPLIISAKGAVQGEEIVTIGSPFGLKFSTNRGMVSNTFQNEKTHLFQTDLASDKSNGGGIIFNKYGEVIGILLGNSRNVESQSVNFGIKVKVIRDFLEANEVKYSFTQFIEENDATEKNISKQQTSQIATNEASQKEKQTISKSKSHAEALELKYLQEEKQNKLLASKKENMFLDDERKEVPLELKSEEKQLNNPKNSLRSRERFLLKFGVNTAYYLGSPSNSFEAFDLEKNEFYFAPQVEAVLGYRFDWRNTKRPNVFGVFANYTLVPRDATMAFLKDNDNTLEASNKKLHSSTSLQVGFILKSWFRLSTGVGEQKIYVSPQQIETLNYYTTTVGFIAKLKNVSLDLNITGLYGNQLPQVSLYGSVGVHFYLNFGKF